MAHRSHRWNLKLYESSRGEQYVEAFIRSLAPATTAKVIRTVDLLESYGPQLGMPHMRKLSKTISELRIRGKVEIRILYGTRGNSIYLLHAFQKKSQLTPRRALELVEARWRELT